MSKNEFFKEFLQLIKSLFASFSCVILTYVAISCISPSSFPPINNLLVLQLFVTCVAVVITQFLIGLLQFSVVVTAVLFFVDMFAVVFLLGHFAFGFFKDAPMNYIFISAMLVVVYVVTYALSYRWDYNSIQEINTMIKNS